MKSANVPQKMIAFGGVMHDNEGNETSAGACANTPGVDDHPKEVNAVTNSSKSSPTVSPRPSMRRPAQGIIALRKSGTLCVRPTTISLFGAAVLDVTEPGYPGGPDPDRALALLLDDERIELVALLLGTTADAVTRVLPLLEQRPNATDPARQGEEA